MRVKVFIKLITNYYNNIDFHKNKCTEAMQAFRYKYQGKIDNIPLHMKTFFETFNNFNSESNHGKTVQHKVHDKVFSNDTK